MQNLVEAYFNALTVGESKSEHTLRGYRSSISKLQRYFSINTVDQLMSLTEDDYVKFYSVECGKGNTLNTHIRNLSAFFNWAAGRGHVAKDYSFFKVKFGKGKFVKIAKTKKLVLNLEEEKALISGGTSVQDRFLIALVLFTGIRNDEARKIKLEDISSCKILIHGKGEKERVVVMDNVLCEALNLYLEERDTDSPYLFYPTRGEYSEDGKLTGTTVYNRVKAAGKRAGFSEEKLAKLTPHRLRGTAATRLIWLYDGNLELVRRILGHSSVATTKIYDETDSGLAEYALLNQRKLIENKMSRLSEMNNAQ
jgi:site-specific recombinase XerD